MKIRDVMTKELIKSNPDSELEDAMKIMITKGIRRLVVGDLLGIVTVRDLVYGWLEGKKAG
ncbi:CBS domain-containing protein [Metallosphaera hakonensis]|uniref:CBS domain-containing protein n=1 Tax=Metallosphaera hakonensis TaxID=79601 RepID=UPI0006CF5FF4|nr:CBS domain-containing protein [Metallosphaera hakonensis]